PCLGAAGTGTVQAGAGDGTRRSMPGGGTAHRIAPGGPARLNRARANEACIAARHRCGMATGAPRIGLCVHPRDSYGVVPPGRVGTPPADPRRLVEVGYAPSRLRRPGDAHGAV